MEEAHALEMELDGPMVRKKQDYNQEFIKRLKYAKEIVKATLGNCKGVVQETSPGNPTTTTATV